MVLEFDQPVSGAAALAWGALEGGASVVTGYAGSPTTLVVDEIVAHSSADEVRVEWTSNEKVAIDVAFGASLAGVRSLLCVKGVGLNVALDPLMTLVLSGCHAGMVLLVGDDPGGWGSQNEQDSRMLALAAEMPLLEPRSVRNARRALREAFVLSEDVGMPVMVRITRALTLDREVLAGTLEPDLPETSGFVREYMRWVVLPVNVVSYHRRLRERLTHVQEHYERSDLNEILGGGPVGVIAAGYTGRKVLDLLPEDKRSELSLLSLGTVNPLPSRQVLSWLESVDAVLVVEETAPVVERAVRSLAHRKGVSVPVYGRETGHVPWTGELAAPQLVQALNAVLPDLGLQAVTESGRDMPSRQPLCDGCPYVPVFDALVDVMDRAGGRDAYIVVGDPGCMVRGQLAPYKLIDVKTSLGSSIGIASGLVMGRTARRVVALSGDSSFLHTGLGELMDAAQLDLPLLVIILDNGTTALSGGQPHAGSARDARGQPRRAIELGDVAAGLGAKRVQVIEVEQETDLRAEIMSAFLSQGLSVIVARGLCPKHVDI
jgi:indolepyruvate ferredoxin oxidoreductase alpha subunit